MTTGQPGMEIQTDLMSGCLCVKQQVFRTLLIHKNLFMNHTEMCVIILIQRMGDIG